MNNIILSCDSYKFSHYNQLPPDAEIVHSYWATRGGEFDEITFFGLQYVLKKHFVGRVLEGRKYSLDYAERRVNDCIQRPVFNRAGWKYLWDTYHGILP